MKNILTTAFCLFLTFSVSAADINITNIVLASGLSTNDTFLALTNGTHTARPRIQDIINLAKIQIPGGFGSASNLTPWTSDIDANNWSLTNARTVISSNVLDSSNVKFWGAKADGSDDTTNIQAAINSLTFGKKLLFPEGDYYVTELVFNAPENCGIEMLGRLVYTGTNGTCLDVGTATNSRSGYSFSGLSILDQMGTGDVGIRVHNCLNGNFQFKRLYGFATNLFIYSDYQDGTAWNTFTFDGQNAARGDCVVIARTGGGYCSENNFYGGNFGISANAGSHHLFNLREVGDTRIYAPSAEVYLTNTILLEVSGESAGVLLSWPRIEEHAGHLPVIFGERTYNCHFYSFYQDTYITDLGTNLVFPNSYSSPFQTASYVSYSDPTNLNVSFGANTPRAAGVLNTALGSSALYKNTGNYNTGVGAGALPGAYSGSSASAQTALGVEAGKYVTSGYGNVYLGWRAGPTAAQASAVASAEAYKLYINVDSGTPLIGGDFWGRTVSIDGLISDTNGLIIGGTWFNDPGNGIYSTNTPVTIGNPTNRNVVLSDVSRTELLLNGGFASNTNDWVTYGGFGILASVAGGVSGNCLQLTTTTGDAAFAGQTLFTTPGITYRLSCWIRNGTCDASIGVMAGSDAFAHDLSSDTAGLGTNWHYYKTTFTATNTVCGVSIFAYGTAGQTAFVDSVSLREVSGLVTADYFYGDGSHLTGLSWPTEWPMSAITNSDWLTPASPLNSTNLSGTVDMGIIGYGGTRDSTTFLGGDGQYRAPGAASATNVMHSAAGSGIGIVTNGLLYTISATGATGGWPTNWPYTSITNAPWLTSWYTEWPMSAITNSTWLTPASSLNASNLSGTVDMGRIGYGGTRNATTFLGGDGQYRVAGASAATNVISIAAGSGIAVNTNGLLDTISVTGNLLKWLGLSTNAPVAITSAYANRANVTSSVGTSVLGLDAAYNFTVTGLTPDMLNAQLASANLSEWAGLSTNGTVGITAAKAMSGWPTQWPMAAITNATWQWGTQNGTNWAQLGTNGTVPITVQSADWVNLNVTNQWKSDITAAMSTAGDLVTNAWTPNGPISLGGMYIYRNNNWGSNIIVGISGVANLPTVTSREGRIIFTASGAGSGITFTNIPMFCTDSVASRTIANQGQYLVGEVIVRVVPGVCTNMDVKTYISGL